MDDPNSPLGGPLELPGEPQKPSLPPSYPKHRLRGSGKKLVTVIVVLIIITGLGYSGWKFLHKAKKQPASPSSSSQSTDTKSQTINDVPAVSDTQLYENGFLGFSLTQPKNWKVTETPDNGVRIESPGFTYQTIAKGSVTGYFRLYIRKGARDSDSKYIGRGVAIQPSEKLTYTNPAPDQRKETLLSAFGLDAPDNFAFFMIAGNFQLKRGDTLGPTYGKEAATFIIAGGFSANDLKDDFATNTVPTDLYSKSNAYKQAVEMVKSLQLH